MIYFPTIAQPSYPMQVDNEDTSLKSTFEDGTVQSRRKFTKSRRTFHLTWNSLGQNDYNTLMNFIRNTVYFSALTFQWTNPQTSEKIIVRVTDGFNSWELKELSYWTGKIVLQEA